MCSRLVQVQIDVGKSKPGAVGLTTCVDSQRRRRHGGGGDLRSGRNVLTARQCREGGLGRGVTRGHRSATPFRPRKPFGV